MRCSTVYRGGRSLPWLLLGLLVPLVACGGEEQGARSYALRPSVDVGLEAPAVAGGAPSPAVDELGDGFVVWESNRSGAWRLWSVPLAGGEPRQLTADEEGRAHCCPHISPDGSQIAYLSVVERAREYPQPTETGALRLLAADGSGERVLVPAARTYFENRAVVWRSDSELVFIDAAGVTRLLDLPNGGSTPLTSTAAESYGWLVDPSLEHATSGSTLFSRYDAESRRVLPTGERGGSSPISPTTVAGASGWRHRAARSTSSSWRAGGGTPFCARATPACPSASDTSTFR